MVLKYTSVSEFWSFLGISEHVLDFQEGQEPQWESVGTGNSSNTEFYLDRMGVDSDTLVLRRDSDNAELTLTTHYTFDSDRSKITLTATGVTYLGTTSLQAKYAYSSLGKNLNYSESVRILERAEQTVDESCETVFADQTDTDPTYAKVVNEKHPGQGYSSNLVNAKHYPIVKLQTTTNGAYTTGGVSITLTDASGFPSSATIYIGGNSVTYTAKTGNVLTVPSSTPSIATGSVVRGEVVEISLDPGGIDPSYTVLVPGRDYGIDYDTGEIQLQDDYYLRNLYGLVRPEDGINDRIRLNYMTAWHPVGQACEIPADIIEACYLKSAATLTDSTILKSNVNLSENFSPTALKDVNDRINQKIERYKILKIGRA